MQTFVVYALARNCFLQAEMSLSPNLTATPLGDLVGLSEAALVDAFLKRLTGGKEQLSQKVNLAEQYGRSQPVCVLKREGVKTAGPQEAEQTVHTEIVRAVRLLSLITGNAGQVVAFVIRSKEESWVRMSPPHLSKRYRLGFGNIGPSYDTMIQEHFDKAARQPRLELLLSLLYDARIESTRDFAFLKYWTLLDTASSHVSVPRPAPGESEAAMRIKALFGQMNVGISMGPIDPSYKHNEDIIDITRIVRNRTAHDGAFDPNHARVPSYCKDAYQHIESILDQLSAYSEVAISFVANTQLA
jgi:hypothetical protein